MASFDLTKYTEFLNSPQVERIPIHSHTYVTKYGRSKIQAKSFPDRILNHPLCPANAINQIFHTTLFSLAVLCRRGTTKFPRKTIIKPRQICWSSGFSVFRRFASLFLSLSLSSISSVHRSLLATIDGHHGLIRTRRWW